MAAATDDTFDELDQLLGSYFGQDMDLIAENEPEAIAVFARQANRDEIAALIDCISRFRAAHAGNLDTAFAERYASDIDLSQLGLSADDFLTIVEDIASDPAAVTAYQHPDDRSAYPHLADLSRACRDLPFVSEEARRHGVPGASSTAHAIAIHAGRLDADEKAALMSEMRRFTDEYGDRADEVYSRRFLPLAHRGVAGTGAFFAMVTAIFDNPDRYRAFTSPDDAAATIGNEGFSS